MDARVLYNEIMISDVRKRFPFHLGPWDPPPSHTAEQQCACICIVIFQYLWIIAADVHILFKQLHSMVSVVSKTVAQKYKNCRGWASFVLTAQKAFQRLCKKEVRNMTMLQNQNQKTGI